MCFRRTADHVSRIKILLVCPKSRSRGKTPESLLRGEAGTRWSPDPAVVAPVAVLAPPRRYLCSAARLRVPARGHPPTQCTGSINRAARAWGRRVGGLDVGGLERRRAWAGRAGHSRRRAGEGQGRGDEEDGRTPGRGVEERGPRTPRRRASGLRPGRPPSPSSLSDTGTETGTDRHRRGPWGSGSARMVGRSGPRTRLLAHERHPKRSGS